MKDITEDVFKSMLENKSKRTLVMDGVDVEIPDDLLRESIMSRKILETDELLSIKQNYKEYSKCRRIPLRWVKFLMQNSKQSLTNKGTAKEHMRLMKAHKKEYNDVVSEIPSVWNIIQGKLDMQYAFYLHGMRLENIEHIENELFGAYTFDIVDSRGTRMQGVYVDHRFTETMIHRKAEDNSKEKINMLKSNIPTQPFIMVCRLSSTKQKIQVLHIQDGGREVRPDLPFVRV